MIKRIAITTAALAATVAVAAPSHAATGAGYISTNDRVCSARPHISPSASCVRTEVFAVGDYQQTRTRSVIFAGGVRVWRSAWSTWHVTR